MRKILALLAISGVVALGSAVTGPHPGVAFASDQFTGTCTYNYSGGAVAYEHVTWTVNYPNTVLSIDSTSVTGSGISQQTYYGDGGVGSSSAYVNWEWVVNGAWDEHTMWVNANGTYNCG